MATMDEALALQKRIEENNKKVEEFRAEISRLNEESAELQEDSVEILSSIAGSPRLTSKEATIFMRAFKAGKEHGENQERNRALNGEKRG